MISRLLIVALVLSTIGIIFSCVGCGVDPNLIRRQGAIALRQFSEDFDEYDKQHQEEILAVNDGTKEARLKDYIDNKKTPIKAAINVVNAVLQSKDVSSLVMKLVGAWSDLAVLLTRIGIPVKLPALSFFPPWLEEPWALARIVLIPQDEFGSCRPAQAGLVSEVP